MPWNASVDLDTLLTTGRWPHGAPCDHEYHAITQHPVLIGLAWKHSLGSSLGDELYYLSPTRCWPERASALCASSTASASANEVACVSSHKPRMTRSSTSAVAGVLRVHQAMSLVSSVSSRLLSRFPQPRSFRGGARRAWRGLAWCKACCAASVCSSVRGNAQMEARATLDCVSGPNLGAESLVQFLRCRAGHKRLLPLLFDAREGNKEPRALGRICREARLGRRVRAAEKWQARHWGRQQCRPQIPLSPPARRGGRRRRADSRSSRKFESFRLHASTGSRRAGRVTFTVGEFKKGLKQRFSHGVEIACRVRAR